VAPCGSRSWAVLVLFGASGTGKSVAAAEIGRRYGIPWVQVDDLRLTLQYSRVTLPERTDELYFLERTSGVWTRTPAELRQAFINVAELMAPALRTVIHSHVVTGAPMVIEGDGVLPALGENPLLKSLVDTGVIRFCCTATPGVDELLENMLARGRGVDAAAPDRPRAQAAANEAFGRWLEGEATRLDIPIVASRPFDTFPDRILQAVH
jgi:2-phosphoglycerate kinase